MNKLRYSGVFSAGDFHPFAFHPFRLWIYDAQRKLLVYVSKCTYFRPKMTNSRVDVNFLAGGTRNYETKIRNPVDSGDNFKGFFHCSLQRFREGRKKEKRTSSGFHHFFSLVPSLPKLLPPFHPYPRSFSKCSKRKIAGGIALKPRSDHHLGPKIYLQRYLTGA